MDYISIFVEPKTKTMISAIIIDDEINAIKALAIELNNFKKQISVNECFTSVLSAIEYLKDHSIDVVFLDMEMPEMNGLDFLDHFHQYSFHVVFTTAYSKYAINAIKKDAIDYLLKPIDILDLQSCLVKIEKVLSKDHLYIKLDEALEKLNSIKEIPKKIKLLHNGKLVFYKPDDILYCEGDGNYSWIYFNKTKRILLSKKLKQMEEDLPEAFFYRVHNSYIINLNKIESYNKNEGIVILENNILIPVSRQKRNNILSKI